MTKTSPGFSCECQFCREFAEPPATPNRVFWEQAGFVLLPTIGCFSAGYCLLMPRKHVRSFADVAPDDLQHALTAVEQVRLAVSREFGPAIVAEHGPGEPWMKTASCCDHAHWHIIPTDVQRVCAAYEEAGGPPETITSIKDLRVWSGRPYIYLSPMRHVHWVWADSDAFGQQFVRVVCSRVRELEPFYDWAVFPFTENMLVTRTRLASSLSSIEAVA